MRFEYLKTFEIWKFEIWAWESSDVGQVMFKPDFVLNLTKNKNFLDYSWSVT